MNSIRSMGVEQTRREPMTGIFWLHNCNLIVHGTPLPRSERYGDCLTSPVSHIDYWTELQRNGQVPRDVEYEEPPRGRVVFDTVKQEFIVFADCCILRRQDVIRKIIATMALPTDVATATDEHYRCYHCLYHSGTSEE